MWPHPLAPISHNQRRSDSSGIAQEPYQYIPRRNFLLGTLHPTSTPHCIQYWNTDRPMRFFVAFTFFKRTQPTFHQTHFYQPLWLILFDKLDGPSFNYLQSLPKVFWPAKTPPTFWVQWWGLLVTHIRFRWQRVKVLLHLHAILIMKTTHLLFFWEGKPKENKKVLLPKHQDFCHVFRDSWRASSISPDGCGQNPGLCETEYKGGNLRVRSLHGGE